ncbi:cobyrinic acid a,c-diamide synthase [Methylonatrum kenyense]|uniref:cobyrinic acid a,c-diamide synthase n=1 Tax=Methylonatrum kenyense TaxID=455253 RepID=UPI0020BDE9DC|nr:cobyrinic acid a,c-diamide synthase [Methylonatrum kenyense]MCK8515887.1 cobyrinic acid a,c-diamide synthase [Methylonatrum kenyense]
MLNFLQGFSYGLFLSCIPWFIIGLLNPRLAVPTLEPSRWQVVLRYWLLLPGAAFLLWLTSLWGGFGPTLGGWLAGLAAVAVALPVERWWHRWRARRAERRRQAAAAAADRAESERGVARLNPDAPPADADDLVKALCRAKGVLLAAECRQHAGQADRLYSRYRRLQGLLDRRFGEGELAAQRGHAVVREVVAAATERLQAIAAQAEGLASLDEAYARRRLDAAEDVDQTEIAALQRRLQLIAETRARLDRMASQNETALTALDELAIALARLDTSKPRHAVSTEQALLELQRFLDRTDDYTHSARRAEGQ